MKQLPSLLAGLAVALIGSAAFGPAAGAAPPAVSPAVGSAGDGGAAAGVAAAPPATGAGDRASDADSPQDDGSDTQHLEAQLQAARRRLEEAARQVAELSARMGQPLIQRFATFMREPGAYFGVRIDFRSAGDGVRVLHVVPGGPAAQAGLRAGDVITSVNGTALTGHDAPHRLIEMTRGMKPGSVARVQVRRDGKTETFRVTAQHHPDFAYFSHRMPLMHPAGPGLPAFPFGAPFGGRALSLMQGPLADMELATLSPRLGSYFGTDKGVLVVRAPADGALKLEDGDVILSIGGRKPLSGPHATRILATYQPGERITLEIMRHKKVETITTTFPRRSHGGPGLASLTWPDAPRRFPL